MTYSDTLSLDDFIRYRRLGWSYERIARHAGMTANQVARYGKTALPPDLRRSRTIAQRDRCPRCELIPWPENPRTPSGLCLWCELETRGVDLLTWHESGAAQPHIAHAQALRRDGTLSKYETDVPIRPKLPNDPGCTHPHEPSEPSYPTSHTPTTPTTHQRTIPTTQPRELSI